MNTRAFIEGIVWFVLVVWSVFGLVFWLPLLSRQIAIFSFSTLMAALSGGSATTQHGYLEAAIRFYSDGFRIIRDSINTADKTERPPYNINWDSVIREIATTAIFWASLFLFVQLMWWR